MDKDLLTLVQQNVNDLIDDSNNIKSVLDQQIEQLASVNNKVFVFEDQQLCHGIRLDEHDEELTQQQENLQEMKETLERLFCCQRAINERLSMQVHALQEDLSKTVGKVEQLKLGLTSMTDKVQHKVEQLEQGLTVMTDKVQHLDQEVESLKMKDVKSGKVFI